MPWSPGANVFRFLGIDGLFDIRRLLFDGDNDVASLVIEAFGGVVVANVLDGVANDLLVVDSGGGGDLAKNHDHAGFTAGFAGDAGHFVTSDAGIEDCV